MAPGSALRVVVNGSLVGEIALPPGPGLITRQRIVLVPVANIRPFGNTVLFNFDFVPANRDAVTSPVLMGEILCNSSLDLHGLALWTRMPNLDLFADAGFPFTQLADLSQTVVVLPSTPSAQEIALYLHLMSHFGAQTGYPALGVTVTGPGNVIAKGRDYLVLGTIADQPAFNSLGQFLPATFDDTGIHIKQDHGLSADIASIQSIFLRWRSEMFGKTPVESVSPNDGGRPDVMVEETKSPVSPDRSIVTIALRQDSAADEFVGALLDPSKSSGMTDSYSLLRNSTFRSYASNVAAYHVGNISWYATMRIYLTQHFVVLLLVVLALGFLCARYAYGWMAWHAKQRLKPAEMTREDE